MEKITFEQLQKSLTEAQNNAEPVREELDKIKKDFKQKFDEIELPFKNMYGEYLDQKLIDKNGASIKVGDTITNGKQNYKVVNRGVQFILGQMFNNPAVTCKRIREDETISANSKEKYLVPSDLVEYEKI